MKVTTNKGVVTLVSENNEEAVTLFTFSLGENAWQNKPQDLVVTKPKAHKTHVFMQKCEICGRKCKGKKGLGLHRYHSHGIKAKDHDFNKAWREKKAREAELEERMQF
jgi:hypothetical protein